MRVDGLNVHIGNLARTVLPGLDIGIVVFSATDIQFTGTPHLAEGVVSSVDDAHGTFEHDAPVDDGNFGGPIFELASGSLVGLVEGQPAISIAGADSSPTERARGLVG